jgi:hypothetical protein
MLGREPTDADTATATATTTTKKKAMKPRDTIVKRKAPTTGTGKQQIKKQTKKKAKAKEAKEDGGDEENMEEEEAEDEEQKMLVGMSVPELKAELRKRGQKVGGRKEELVRRLVTAVRREREWDEERKRAQELAGDSLPLAEAEAAAEEEWIKTKRKELHEVTGGREEASEAADAHISGERLEEEEGKEEPGEGEDGQPRPKKEEAPPTKRKRTIAIP